MGLNDIPSSERIHIAFFGVRNAGKSSLVNAITNQEMALVSAIKGTTTDPIKRSMELIPVGPVCIVDTPGIDDEGILGEKRVNKAYQILSTTDIAVLVSDVMGEFSQTEYENYLKDVFREQKVPFVVAHNKCDLISDKTMDYLKGEMQDNEIFVSAEKKINLDKLLGLIEKIANDKKNNKRIVGDLLDQGDIVLMVTPIDESAPKGRLILPQQLVLRDVLDSHGIAITCQEKEFAPTLLSLKKAPRLVVTDSQVFKSVAGILPPSAPLTSFSILMARYKGDLDIYLKGAQKLSELKDGNRILIAEGCTHTKQCGDISTEKLPKWIQEFSGKKLEFEFKSGTDFTETPEKYDLIVHCGGCMLGNKEMQSRVELARRWNIPIVNFGIAIAYMNGILDRCINVFGNTNKEE